MGYYSQVAIGIAPHCVQEVLPVIQEVKPDVAEFTYNWHVFVWKNVEWHEDVPQIRAVERKICSLPAESFYFVRIGEEIGDIEQWGGGNAPIDVETKIYINKDE